MDTNDIKKIKLYEEYQIKKKIWEKLISSVKADLDAILVNAQIKTSKIEGRVKDFDSFYEKLEREKIKQEIENPLDYIQDMAGVRIVLLFIDDLNKIEELLNPTFRIYSIQRKHTELPEDQFGYESDHYILTYHDVKGPGYNEINKIKFELQVRTILMDAWASVSHKLDYKNKESIPSHLRRVFYGLSGTFVVADKVFQDLKNSSEESKKEQIEKTKRPFEFLNQEINFDTFKAYLQFKFPERWENEEILFSSKRVDEQISDLIKEIKNLGGYEKLKDLDEAVEAGKKIEFEAEKEAFPNGGRRMLVGTIRGILDLYDDKYFKRNEHLIAPQLIKLEQRRKKMQNKKIREHTPIEKLQTES